MFNAIYYPHTAIRDEGFLKHSLLYWDDIEFVSPFHEYDALSRYPDSVVRELARFIRPHVPTQEEKERAHCEIVNLVSDDLPAWLQIGTNDPSEDHGLYFVYRDKLLPETWEELRRRNLVAFVGTPECSDAASHTYLRLTMMGILARCCAGRVKHTITDRGANSGSSHRDRIRSTVLTSGELRVGNPDNGHRKQIPQSAERACDSWCRDAPGSPVVFSPPTLSNRDCQLYEYAREEESSR